MALHRARSEYTTLYIIPSRTAWCTRPHDVRFGIVHTKLVQNVSLHPFGRGCSQRHHGHARIHVSKFTKTNVLDERESKSRGTQHQTHWVSVVASPLMSAHGNGRKRGNDKWYDMLACVRTVSERMRCVRVCVCPISTMAASEPGWRGSSYVWSKVVTPLTDTMSFVNDKPIQFASRM